MKLYCLIPLPPPIHGSSIVSENIAKQLNKFDDIELKILNIATSRSLKRSPLGNIIRFLRLFSIFIKLVVNFTKFKPDIIYISPCVRGIGFFKDLTIILFVRFYRKKIVYHFHNLGIRSNSKNKLLNYFHKKIFTGQYCIILGKTLIKEVEQHFDENKIYICPNGIEDHNFLESTGYSEELNVYFLSNLYRSKGILEFLEVAKTLKHLSNINFYVIGADAEFTVENLKEFISKFPNNKSIHLLGPTYGNEKKEILKKMHIMLHPSKDDIQPLSILEAMAYGHVVISSFVGCIPEIIESKFNGYLLEPKQVKEASNLIKQMYYDRDIVSNIGQNARTKFENHYSQIVQGKRIRGILNDVFKDNFC